MKPILPLAALTGVLVFQAVQAQQSQDPSRNYDYLVRMHVPDAVVQCVEAFDQWVVGAPKYESVMVPDRRVLNAQVDKQAAVFSTANPVPVDEIVEMRAFAKARGKPIWTRVTSRCGMRDGQVVSVSFSAAPKPSAVN